MMGKEGQGFRQMLSGLDAGRIGIGTQACGIGKAALEDALNYAKERIQFGKTISTFQAIQFKLADMATEETHPLPNLPLEGGGTLSSVGEGFLISLRPPPAEGLPRG